MKTASILRSTINMTLDSRVKSYFLICLFLLINAGNQILFKHLAVGPGGRDVLALVYHPLFYAGGALFGLQAAIWIAVLRSMPLSVAYPITSLTIIMILPNAAIFFGEPISLGNILGSLVIMAGVVVLGTSKVDRSPL